MRAKKLENTGLVVARIALLVFFLSCILGCSEQKLAPLQQGDVILAFGDSLTAGIGADENQSYPSVLAELSGLEVINAGISGETTQEGAERLAQELDAHQPALLILIEGGNDILRNRSAASIKRDLASMIDTAKASGVPVVLIGVPQKKLFSSSAPWYRELAEEHGLVFEGEVIGSLMRSPSMKSDPIHFNAEGYRAMAEAIYELLKDNGAL